MNGMNEAARAARRDRCSAIILCGGRSTRFGEGDKAEASLGGRTFLDRVSGVAKEVASEVILATGGRPRHERLGLPVVLDDPRSSGPLGGIVAGLEAASRDLFVIMAVDLPLVSPTAVDVLFDALGGFDLVMPRRDGRLEPLFCAGRRGPCLVAARKVLAMEHPAPHRLAELARTKLIDVSGSQAGKNFKDSRASELARGLVNVNTPDDLRLAEDLWKAPAEGPDSV